MNRKADNKWFYWFEGVTARAVRRHLDEPATSIWHRKHSRQFFVILQTLVVPALALQCLWVTPEKWPSYIEFGLLAGAIVVYFCLRKSVRLLSDAPDELLDERQVSLRDAAHTRAYRILAITSVLYLILYVFLDERLQNEDLLMPERASDIWVNLILSYAIWAASLPAMILAWTLPEERPFAQ